MALHLGVNCDGRAPVKLDFAGGTFSTLGTLTPGLSDRRARIARRRVQDRSGLDRVTLALVAQFAMIPGRVDLGEFAFEFGARGADGQNPYVGPHLNKGPHPAGGLGARRPDRRPKFRRARGVSRCPPAGKQQRQRRRSEEKNPSLVIKMRAHDHPRRSKVELHPRSNVFAGASAQERNSSQCVVLPPGSCAKMSRGQILLRCGKTRCNCAMRPHVSLPQRLRPAGPYVSSHAPFGAGARLRGPGPFPNLSSTRSAMTQAIAGICVGSAFPKPTRG
jgi:hypothetical protein